MLDERAPTGSTLWLTSLALLVIGCATGCRSGPSPFEKAMRTTAEQSRRGEHERAAESYQKLSANTSKARDRDEALYAAGVAYEHAGDTQAALKVWDELARGDSDRAVRAAFRAALLRREAGQTARAQGDLLELLRRAPGHGVARRALAIVTEDMTRASGEAAVIDWEAAWLRSLGKTRLGEEVAYDLAHRRERTGDLAGAARDFSAMADRWPYPHGALWDDALWYASLAHEKLGDPRAAIADLEKMLAEHETSWFYGSYNRPRMPAAQFRLGELHRSLGEWDAAAQSFRQLRERFPQTLLVARSRLEEARVQVRLAHPEVACRLAHELLTTAADTRWARQADEVCPAVRPEVERLKQGRHASDTDLPPTDPARTDPPTNPSPTASP